MRDVKVDICLIIEELGHFKQNGGMVYKEVVMSNKKVLSISDKIVKVKTVIVVLLFYVKSVAFEEVIIDAAKRSDIYFRKILVFVKIFKVKLLLDDV